MSAVGAKSRSFWRAMYPGILLVISFALSSCGSLPSASAAASTTPVPETGPIHVTILNTYPKIKTAVVRVMETNETDTLDQGALVLTSCVQGQHISVWSPGHFISTILCSGTSPIEYPVTLEAFNAADNPNYLWVDADIRASPTLNCARCHSNTLLGLNEYAEWNLDGHSRAFTSQYFLTTYMGTDLNRNPGQETFWSISGNGRRIRLPPDPTRPYYGPGYNLDYPNESGNCIYCHIPAGAVTMQQVGSLTSLINSSWGSRTNAPSEGVTCDVCHKVTDVFLGQDRLPFVERPGVLSFSFVRLSSGPQFAIGPRPDQATFSTEIKQTCSPIFSKSEFCAPCHYGKFSDIEIYGSYREWLDSPYSQPLNFRSCQDCHMPSPKEIGNTSLSERSACSEENLEFRDFNHNMMKYGLDPVNNSRTIPLMVTKAAQISVDEVSISEGQIKFRVMVLNTGAGHKFPTDSPLRHLILLVDAKDENGNSLTQVGGQMIPKLGDSDYVGYAGQIYANVLKDRDTNVVPTIAYWNPVVPAWQGSDTRLVPGVPVYSEYSFVAPSDGSATITVRLIYRNVFYDIAHQKGLLPVDIEAVRTQLTVP